MTQIFPSNHPDALKLARIRRLRRMVLLVGALTILPFAAFSAPRVWGRIQTRLAMETARRACLRFTRPGERVIYEDDPVRVATLSDNPRYHKGTFTLSPEGPRNAFEPVDCWQTLIKTGDPSYDQIACPVFVHGRRVGTAAERLVTLNITNREVVAENIIAIDLVVAIVRPIYALYAPDLLTQDYRLELNGNSSTGVRFLAGQVDPQDSSRFTVRYAVGSDDGEMDGHLKIDDTADLRIVRGPGRPVRNR